MDFFERQDKARKNTKLLVVYFVLAVVCIIASVYFVSLLIFAGAAANHPRGAPAEFVLMDSQLSPQGSTYSAVARFAIPSEISA